MTTPWDRIRVRYSAPPPTLQVLFEGEPVAELSMGREGKYRFCYLPAFATKKLAPLPGLPDVDQVYEQMDLFPFFAERIPDLRRPEIQEWIKKEGLDPSNKLQLLGALSRHSVTDSFELRIKAA